MQDSSQTPGYELQKVIMFPGAPPEVVLSPPNESCDLLRRFHGI